MKPEQVRSGFVKSTRNHMLAVKRKRFLPWKSRLKESTGMSYGPGKTLQTFSLRAAEKTFAKLGVGGQKIGDEEVVGVRRRRK